MQSHLLKDNTEIIMKQNILNLSTAIRTPVLPEVYDTIKDIPVDYDGVVKYNTNIIGVKVQIGVGNAGAVGIRLRAAQGSGIEDVEIIFDGSYTE